MIGSKGYSRALCVDWMQPFPNIEEQDAVVIDLRTLDQGQLDRLMKADPSKLDGLIDPFLTLLGTNRKIYCIIQPWRPVTPPPGAGKAYVRPPPSNYSWLPLLLALQEKSGESIERVTDPQFEPYLKLLDKWSLEILGFYAEGSFSPSVVSSVDWFRGFTPESPSSRIEATLTPIALNKSGRAIGAFITTDRGPGSIFLLPPSTRGPSEEGIETILDIILEKKPDVRPRWWGAVDVPGLSQVDGELRAAREQGSKLQTNVEELEKNKDLIENYRDLVSSTGDDLTEVVQKVLSILSLDTETTSPGFPADLIKEHQVAIEVTGISDKVDSDNDKMFQLQRFEENFSKGEKIILVANTYRRIEPTARGGKMDFTPEVEKHFRDHKICALTALGLLDLWRMVEREPSRKEEVRNLILKTDGVLKL